MSPLISLSVGLIFIAILVVLFLGKSGIYWKIKKNREKIMRVLLEDALKHIFDYEYNNSRACLNSVAGKLQITLEKATNVIDELVQLKLAEFKEDSIRLTQEGRIYALRIIRNHRLWERYLADETGIDEHEWHLHAEDAEHHLTNEDAEKLASRIGNPLIDPHGDPIPNAKGMMKRREGLQLQSLQPGDFARVIHIEDEPPAVFSQIVSSGIHMGMQLMLITSDQKSVKVSGEGMELELSPVIASNISVVKLDKSEEQDESYTTLSSLKKGEKAVITGISKACRGQQRRRLMDLGIVKGSEIRYRMISAGKDPIAYDIKGTTIALRKIQTNQIFIKK